MPWLRTVGRVAVPVVAWVGVCMLLVGGYSISDPGLVNNYAGPAAPRGALALLVHRGARPAAPAGDGAARHPRRAALRAPSPTCSPCCCSPRAAFRYHWLVIDGLGNLRFRTHGVAWFFLLGWLAHRSTTRAKRLVTTRCACVTIPGFFERPEREWFIAGGIILLVWWRDLPLPRLAIRPIAVVAAASMWIFVSHFRIWPPLERNLPTGVAYALTILAGVAIWRVSVVAAQLARRWSARSASGDEGCPANLRSGRDSSPGEVW